MAVTSPGEYWRIGGTVDGGTVVSFLTSPQPAPAIGESADVTTRFRRAPGESRLEYRDRHAELLDYATRMGEFVLHEVEGGSVGYTETHDGAVPDGTLVVVVQPPDADAGTHAGRGYWALVETVTDETNRSQTAWALSLSLLYLAPLAQSDSEPGYQTRAALARDLEADRL